MNLLCAASGTINPAHRKKKGSAGRVTTSSTSAQSIRDFICPGWAEVECEVVCPAQGASSAGQISSNFHGPQGPPMVGSWISRFDGPESEVCA